MALNPLRPVLRTVHNGSISTIRTQVNIPPGGELTLPATVAEQLQRDHGAIKDGPVSEAFLDQLYPPVVDEDVPVGADVKPTIAEPEPEPVERPVKKAAARKAS